MAQRLQGEGLLTLRYTVTSMLTMSPSCSGRESGMPWHTHSFTDVHTLFGKRPARECTPSAHAKDPIRKRCRNGVATVPDETEQRSRHSIMLTISERRGVCAIVNNHLVHRAINLVCRHPRLQQEAHELWQLSGDPGAPLQGAGH